MVQAVLHIIIPLVILDLIRHYYFNKSFPRYIVLIGGIAGLLPDIDVPISWILSLLTNTTISIHGQITHTVLFALPFLILSGILYTKTKKLFTKKDYKPLIYLVIGMGILTHIFLDCLAGGNSFLWPISTVNYCPTIIAQSIVPGLDAILLVLWLIHEETHNMVKDYF